MGTTIRLTIAIACCAVAGAVRADLDLTPTPSTYQVDGVTFPRLAFSDGTKQVTYAPPKGWESFGSAMKLTVRPKNKTQAEASVRRLSLQAPMSLDDENLKALVAEALATVPAGSSDVKVLQQETNPILIDGKGTFLVIMSYNFRGETYGQSVMFMPRGNEQLRFQFVSRLADFKDLHKAFFGSNFTWQGL
ncbi:MAG: hypothetical protein ACXWHF_00995 [Chthoniobacterales bacterium]